MHLDSGDSMIFANQHDLASQGSHADARSLRRAMPISPAVRFGMSRLTGVLLGSTALVGIIVSAPAFAGSLSWNGGTSTDWTDPTNWSTNTAPTSADSVSIDTGASHVPIIDGQAAS